MEKAKEFFKQKRNIILLVTSLIFIILLINVLTGNIQKFDDNIYGFVESIRNENLTNILKVITDMGGTVGLSVITLLTVIILFIFNKRKYAISVTLNIAISTVSYILLKNIIQRPRPLVSERLIEEAGYSFPSGHSTNNIAFYGFAVFLIYTNVKNIKLRNILCVILSIIPLVIGFSRIYLRVHYPSDVIAGFCLGVFCVTVFLSTIYKKIKE